MSRPIGSKNKIQRKPTRVVAVRLTVEEVRALRAVHRTLSKALKTLIARLAPQE